MKLMDLFLIILIVVIIVIAIALFREDLKTAKKHRKMIDIQFEYYECVPKYLKVLCEQGACCYNKCLICSHFECLTGQVARQKGRKGYYQFLADIDDAEDVENDVEE